MRRHFELWFVLALGLFSANAWAERPRLVVLGFGGDSRNQQIVGGAFTSITSGRLVNSGKFEVVKAEAAGETIAAKGGVKMLGSANAVAEVGKALGCQYVIYGSVLDADVATSRFSGYGVTTFKTTFGLRVDLKILNVFDGKVVFSKLLEASEAKVNLNNPDGFSGPIFAELSKRAVVGLEHPMLQALDKDIRESAPALEKFLEDTPAASSQLGRQPASGRESIVKLSFDCTVPSASVEIDGIVEGVCSDSIPVQAGLHDVTVTARNYQPYKTKIRLTKDTVVSVELVAVKSVKK